MPDQHQHSDMNQDSGHSDRALSHSEEIRRLKAAVAKLKTVNLSLRNNSTVLLLQSHLSKALEALSKEREIVKQLQEKLDSLDSAQEKFRDSSGMRNTSLSSLSFGTDSSDVSYVEYIQALKQADELESQVIGLKEELSKSKKKVDSLNTELESLKEAQARSLQSHDINDSARASLEEDMAEALKLAEASEHELTQLKKELVQLKDFEKNLKKRIDTLEIRNLEINQEAEEQRQVAQSKTIDIENLSSLVKSKEELIQQLSKKVESAESQVSTLKQQILELDTLKQKIKELEQGSTEQRELISKLEKIGKTPDFSTEEKQKEKLEKLDMSLPSDPTLQLASFEAKRNEKMDIKAEKMSRFFEVVPENPETLEYQITRELQIKNLSLVSWLQFCQFLNEELKAGKLRLRDSRTQPNVKEIHSPGKLDPTPCLEACKDSQSDEDQELAFPLLFSEENKQLFVRPEAKDLPVETGSLRLVISYLNHLGTSTGKHSLYDIPRKTFNLDKSGFRLVKREELQRAGLAREEDQEWLHEDFLEARLSRYPCRFRAVQSRV